MVAWQLEYTKRARKDAKKAAAAGLKPRLQRVLDAVAADPFAPPPPIEKLVGDLAGCYSRRINIQHRVVYEVIAASGVVRVHMMFSHYE